MENSPFSSETPPEQDDETQRLIGEVAKRHGIVLGSGDPLCIVLTVLELFLDRYLSRLDGMFQAQPWAASAQPFLEKVFLISFLTLEVKRSLSR